MMKCIDSIKKNPYDGRIIMSAWNVAGNRIIALFFTGKDGLLPICWLERSKGKGECGD